MNSRFFMAFPLPLKLKETLHSMGSELANCRQVPIENLHLTLRFLGHLELSQTDEIMNALSRLETNAFEITVKGIGHFPLRGDPDLVWAGIEPCKELMLFQRNLENILYHDCSIDRDTRNYFPHITLARDPLGPISKLMEFEASHAFYKSSGWVLDRFALFHSKLKPAGPEYTAVETFFLGGPLATDFEE